MRWATTSWTQVLAARDAPTGESRRALEALCRAYWYPVYAFVRREGLSPDDARDATQGYFAELLEKDYLDDCDPAKGRFRAFLIRSVRNFLSKDRDKARAWKRGGRADFVRLDNDVENRYHLEPANQLTPEALFERRWALMLLERVLDQLRHDQVRRGRGPEFERFKQFLTGEEPQTPYRAVAAELRMSEAAVKTSVHRLRRLFGEMLRDAIAETVADPADVDDELRHLLRALTPFSHGS